MNRAEYSEERLAELGAGLEPVAGLLADEPLCIYATGSYGRLEAGPESDVDLFFLYDGRPDRRRLSKLKLIRLSSCLIETGEAMGLPDFSGDGRYLDVHYLDRMEEVLGSPEDDSLNGFTARMLLLLESRPIYGAVQYGKMLGAVSGFYYRDFDDHPEDFEPTFLLNDILRFWRTLTLNYEHDRFEVRRRPLAEQPEARARSALKNYKLKVSRLATCFSMVLHLVSEELPVDRERVLGLCALTPRRRFEELGSEPGAERCVERLLGTYDSFLDQVQRPREELLADFREDRTRRALVAEASAFGREIYELLTLVAPPERLRRLVV